MLLFKMIKQSIKRRNAYFQEGREEITGQNIRMLRDISLAVTLLTIVLLLLTPVILPQWSVSWAHVLLVPGLLIFFLFGFYYAGKAKKSYLVVDSSCVLFVVMLLVFTLVLDIQIYPFAQDAFIQLLLILVPVVFVFPLRLAFLLLLSITVAFILVVCAAKAPDLARHDVFNAVVGFFVAAPVSWLIMRLRVETFHVRCRYQTASITDALTGILNKNNCENRVRDYLGQCDWPPYCALLVLDVDEFKGINDHYGHQVGDAVLEKVGAMLLRIFRTSDIIGRIGGDEFMILLRNLNQQDVVSLKCDAICREIATISVSGAGHISCSIGAVYVPGIRVSYEDLFRSADGAMYEAKAAGKGRYCLHYLYPQPESDCQRVLIAENHVDDRVILRNLLENDFEVMEATDGEQALQMVREYRQSLCLVLLDMEMPKKDGYQILRYLKNHQELSRLPVVVISAEEHCEKTVLQMGAADMVLKPLDPEIMRLRIVNVLKKKNG